MSSSSPPSTLALAVVPSDGASIPPGHGVPPVDAEDSTASTVQKLVTLEDDTLSDRDKQILAIFTNLVRDVSRPSSKEDKGDKGDSSLATISSDAQTAQVPVATTAAAATTTASTTTVATVSAAAATAAAQIRQLCPNPTMTADLEVYLMALWETAILVVKAVPHDSPLQDEIVAVLESLHSHAKATVTLWGREERLWRDLPMLSSFMREAWIEPEPEDDESTEDAYRDQISEWVNLNAFAARITEKGLLRWTVFAVMGISKALEQEPPGNESNAKRLRLYFEGEVQTASQWILLGGTEVFRDAFRTNRLNETELQATPSGPLYVASGGRPGLNMNRWWFWKQRLEELGTAADGARDGDTGIDAKVRTAALQAARHMDDIVTHDGRVIVRTIGCSDNDAADEGKEGQEK